jgi:hypothetical protein
MLAELGDVAVEVAPPALGQADADGDVPAEQPVRVDGSVFAQQFQFVLEQFAKLLLAVHPVKQQHILAHWRGHPDRAVLLGDGHGSVPLFPVLSGF